MFVGTFFVKMLICVGLGIIIIIQTFYEWVMKDADRKIKRK